MAQVAVIVPNYNHAKFLEQRMDSILQQTFVDFEIVLLDDCSTDNSREIIERYRSHPKVKAIKYNETNSGSAFHQWKAGIELSDAPYIWIAESDDFSSPDFLDTAMKACSKGIALFYCRSVVVDADGNEKGDMSSWYGDITDDLRADYIISGDDELASHLFWKNTIANAGSVVFRRFGAMESTLKEINGMRYCGDWLFWMVCADNAAEVAYSVGPRNYFRNHAATTRKQTQHAVRNKEVLRVLRYILQSSLSKGNRKQLFLYFQEHHFELKSRSAWKWNLSLAFVQISVYPAASCWWLNYYLTGRKK